MHAAAEHGISGSPTRLPHADQIQRAFGHHDIGDVQAHADGAAAAGAGAIGAQAFATGDHVAFTGTPALHTAAHEAAHVVQQRSGVQLQDGVSEAGDTYEQHADAVADAVVAGRSAAPLLDQIAGRGPRAAAVQRAPLTPTAAKEAKATDVDSSRGKKGEFLHNDQAGYRATYRVGGDDVLVFVPGGGIVPPTVNIFLFFHGKAANYAGEEVNHIYHDDKGNIIEDTGDNAAKAAKLGEAVTAAGDHNVVGICPARPTAAWEAKRGGGFTKIVDEVLQQLGPALGADKPLVRGHISMAGHSAGGRALGYAAEDLNDDVSDITLQDAGYGYHGDKQLAEDGTFMKSFYKVRDWLLTGKPGKTLRVISQQAPLSTGKDGKAALPKMSNTRFVLAHEKGFNQESFETRIAELTKLGTIKKPLKVGSPHDFGRDWEALADGAIQLESTLTITGPAGVQGTLQIFGINGGHFDVRNKTMAALIANGASGDENIFRPGAPKPGKTP